ITAALYQEFRNGSAGAFGGMIDLTQGASLAADMHALQVAVWYEEGEVGTYGNLSTIEGGATGEAARLWQWGNTHNDGTIGDVRVMQMWTDAALTGHAQDQLTLVPLPSAAYAGMASLAGVM